MNQAAALSIIVLTRLLLASMMKLTMEKSPVMTPENLKAAMRAWSAGVTVVTAIYKDHKHGMTVNSFTSISLDPAMITISLQSWFTHA